MIIPENSKAPNTLKELSTKEDFLKLRNDTTDKLLVVLLYASWDDSSMQLKKMVDQMPSVFASVKFGVVDCDAAPDLVDHFEDVDSVPSLVMCHPHKMAFETVTAPEPS